jgi:DNA-binding NarL/FixJ family response regulator
LTPTEHRVAELAAGGMSHNDIAANLFIARKTVEINLSRIYHKLGIHSRIELYRMFDDARPSARSSDEPASASEA